MKKCEVLLDIPSIRGKVQMQKKKIEGKEEAKVEFPKDRVEVQMKKKKLGRKEGECEAGEGDGSSGKKTLR